ncbi:MAG: hypothetical protein A2845_04285 [Candidatus Lloydbacteria bacterium RIFCSPHIGHO2_01_FULL_49_22]|uniref:Shedu protein SduA C-terminal domain-containing protein n=1 Tax=Candidatus Lloydbacteria bacterium RIFCSPHIGHO2_01_FULL_49_22 TaxID=1798658 RepID=A0A1G2CU70_9BACT|nr:MAG: hypothetical protein A2845_04285 [Candidatus Lloydbacteria bacterium RIFCSPHIGHO2_01_FULL_49_22]OGZ08874.1 MAG: hypothetical protein A3C14_01320 [Candidatus Lloydbacteria bacterium RIFCSPHIGHO2_02_FULL_50_18]
MSNGEYAIKKDPALTYVSRAIGKDGNIRYISKVFELKDFKDFYNDQKEKKVFEVIRESAVQEITAIYNQDTTGFSLRIQRFSKDTGIPHNQSFSFHGGALTRFIKFLESLDLLDLTSKENLKFTDQNVSELVERKNAFSQLLHGSQALTSDQLFQLFNKLGTAERNSLFQKFIENIDALDVESLSAAIKQKEHKEAIANLEYLLSIESDVNFLEAIKGNGALKKYHANQPEGVFHKWIGANLWVFGVEYYKKHTFRKIGEDNSEADIVLETPDGFISLIEVKRPSVGSPLFRYDTSHRCHFPTSPFSEAIGQSLIYLQRIEDYKKTLSIQHSVRILRPRVQLILGRSDAFTEDEKKALHFLNSSLHDIDILTYDQLIQNGKQIISHYEN